MRAWDGSEAGPPAAPTVVLHSPLALRRIMWRPGELGLARAYISGDVDVEGDLTDGLRRVRRALPGRRPGWSPARWAGAASTAAIAASRVGAFGPPPMPPACELRHSGRPHSRARARAVVAGHYDLPVSFFRLILDPSMAYSCGYWASDDAEYGLADAQRDKLDLVCRKLELGPGGSLLDMGCGWGSLTVHAAQHYKAQVTAVTLSAEQGGYASARLRGLGLGGRARVLIQDYRDPPATRTTRSRRSRWVSMWAPPGTPPSVRRCAAGCPGGRLLIQQMSRGKIAPGGGPFIESYVAADMHMRPVGETIGLLERAGLEVLGVESLRPHYVSTIRAWLDNLERNLTAVEAIIGVERARLWRLYLAGGALAFEEGRMGVDQILAARRG